MSNQATIKSIVYKPKNTSETAGPSYLRLPLQEANLLAGHGIQDDRKAGNPKRNLNVMDDITQAELEAEGYPTGAGVLGENIILGGLDLRTLPHGTHLRLGGEAVIEVGPLREPCEQLTPLDARMPAQVEGRVGTMCRVVQSGRIRVGDPVSIVTELAGR